MDLLRRGVSVFSGVRREEDAESLCREASKMGAPGRLLPVILDVTSEESIELAMEQVRFTAGEDGLWALVSNAGVVVPGPVEHLTPGDWRYQFEVNFFSMCELTRQALPLLRQGVRTHGHKAPRIMLVSSIGGRVAQPMIAPYTASKFATSALGDSLRLELRPQGIGVTVLEPGAVSTAIWNKGDDAAGQFSADHPARVLYSGLIDALVRVSRRTAKNAISPDKAAAAATRALFAPNAPARVLVGLDAKALAVLRKWLPMSWFDGMLAGLYEIPAGGA